ncbi:MAG: hypothetical protein KAV00_11855 [Phycisphaerae bacterium]|nr:hypothetical protein [Phycisphaerae bacterium]
MGLYLLNGAPGQKKGGAARKIAAFLRKLGIEVEIADVEEELLDLFPKYKDTGTSNKDPLVSLIGERSQAEIKDRWSDAYKNAVTKATASNPEVAIVVSCLEYYCNETYEFYSPVNCNTIKESKLRCALTLIDDIHEVYYRLSQPGQVFGIQELVERTFPPGSSGRPDSNDLRQLYKDSLGVAVGSLLRVLVWREKEIQCGANLCRTVDCEHSVLAIKHPVSTGARMLLGSTSSEFEQLGITYPIYISHPISRPRRERLSQGVWPPFVDDLDAVVACLSSEPVEKCHIVPIMPTAIDEFRILDDGTYLHPCLTPRWPIHKCDELLYSRPEAPEKDRAFADDEDYEARGLSTIFDPPINSSGRRIGLPLSDPEVSGILRTLKESIRLQMAGRDHLLVRQCPGFFLYRSLYDEFEFSGGVASEINTFDKTREYAPSLPGGKKRRVVFIHDKKDAVGLFTQKEDGNFPDAVHQAKAALQSETYSLAQNSDPKRKSPSVLSDKTVAEAFQGMGDPEEVAKLIHDEMSPPVKEGNIGVEPQSLNWDATKSILKQIVERERVKAFSSDISQKVCYTYSQDKVEWPWPVTTDDSPDTHVDVVEGLDNTPSRRDAAAIRAKEFFAKATD